jgi:hypothetical protein
MTKAIKDKINRINYRMMHTPLTHKQFEKLSDKLEQLYKLELEQA